MYYVLAQIPGRYWMGSVFSVVGLIYLFACLFCFCRGFWFGVGANICLFLLGVGLVYCAEGVNPEKDYYTQRNQIPGFTLVYLDQNGKNPRTKFDLVYEDNWTNGSRVFHRREDGTESWYTVYDRYGRSVEPIYSMHVNGLSPWIFHPSCLYWCPGVIAVPFFLLGMFAFGGVRR